MRLKTGCLGVIWLSIMTVNACAQQNPVLTGLAGEHQKAIQSFYSEVGGAGLTFSLNYDRRFSPRSVFGWGVRVGAGFFTANEERYEPSILHFFYEPGTAFSLPVQLNYLFGREHSPHSFEVGAGATYISKKMKTFYLFENRYSQIVNTFSFAYRLQPLHGGFSWRLAFTPAVGKDIIQPLIGIGAGYNF